MVACNVEILAAAGELRRTVPAYIVAAVEGCYAPLPEPIAPEPAINRVERARTQAPAQAAAAEAERRRLRDEEERQVVRLEAMGEGRREVEERARKILMQKTGIAPGGDCRTNPPLRAEAIALIGNKG